MSGHVGADVNFPPKLAHIGDAVRAGQAHADLNLLGGAKGIGRI